jgi:putative phosphoribosyl transferase
MRSIAEEQIVLAPAGGVTLEGNLAVPPGARGLVIFAHGSGSSRHSPRNRFVAERLRESALGTLLIDLLTAAEEEIDDRTRHLRFDIDLLARRLADTAQWARNGGATRGLPVGYFGASTGGGAALVAAARSPEGIEAVVSRGGRPDLAGRFLTAVEAPTRLIVGGEDTVVIGMNQTAYDRLRCEKDLQIVPGATHLFEEPGTLERVAELAADWFAKWLG